MINVIKKDGSLDLYDPKKIVKAISKSSERVGVTLSEKELKNVCDNVEERITTFGEDRVPVAMMHNFVELALDETNSDVAKSYRDYRNYKKDFVHIMDEVLKLNQNIMYLADHDNANTDSALTSTKRSLLYKKLSKELYQKTFLTPEELGVIRDGYFYIHAITVATNITCIVKFGDLVAMLYNQCRCFHNGILLYQRCVFFCYHFLIWYICFLQECLCNFAVWTCLCGKQQHGICRCFSHSI